jgi:hypothetical protein
MMKRPEAVPARRSRSVAIGAFVVALVLGTGGPAALAAARNKAQSCAEGRFVVGGDELFARSASETISAPHTLDTPHGQAVTLSGRKVEIEGICPPTRAKVRKKGGRLKLKASWKGCEGISGRVRLTASIDAEGCDAMRGRLRAKSPRMSRRFDARRALGNPADCTSEDTFATIQQRIFGAKGCRVETCHGAATAGGLDLRWGAAHFSLVDAPATNGAAAAAGKKRVVPGDAGASFLWQKLGGEVGAGEGASMPPIGSSLDALELELLRAWIEDGAPAVGQTAAAPCLPPHEFEAAPALAPPAGGYQIVLEGPTLEPGQEMEGCMWIKAPNPEDFVVGRFEYSMNPGSHHFALWEHERGGPPQLGVFDPDDLACLKQGARLAITLSGAGEAPYFVDGYPRGIGKVVPGGAYLGLNPHYFNEFDVPIQVKVRINMHPVQGRLEHVADTLLTTFGRLDGKNSYSINVPAFSEGGLRLRWANDTGTPLHVFELSSHQHQRGTHFTAWRSDGTKVFENFDWAHPAIVNYDPPLVLDPGDYFEYECEYDNGVTRQVRRCGDSRFDKGCTPGEPVAVTYGNTAQDEMCFLTGLYYTE